MPLARIDLIKGKPSSYRRTIGDVVYKAMVDILKAPENDRFQVIAEHDAEDFVFDPTFFGIERSADVVFVQLTLAEGRRPPEATTAGRPSSRGHRSRRGGRQGLRRPATTASSQDGAAIPSSSIGGACFSTWGNSGIEPDKGSESRHGATWARSLH